LHPELRSFLRDRLAQVLVLTLTLVSIVLYAYATEPGSLWFAEWFGFAHLAGDWPQYLNRFVAAAILLLIVPLTLAFAAGYRPGQLGLCGCRAFLTDWLFWVIAIVMISVTLCGVYDEQLAAFYPLGKSIAAAARDESASWFLLHLAGYVGLNYVAWEVCFRAVLLWPLLGNPRELGPRGELPPGMTKGQAIVTASAQSFGCTLLHLHHPLSETLGAVAFGLISGFLVIRYRSLLPGLLLHASLGVSLDAALIFGR
jgi:membrane protease YdiL (CAAX protease family)